MYSCTERCAMLVNGDVRASSFLFCWKGRKSNGAAAVTTGKEREREREGDKNFDKSGLTSPTCHYYDPLVRSLSLSFCLSPAKHTLYVICSCRLVVTFAAFHGSRVLDHSTFLCFVMLAAVSPLIDNVVLGRKRVDATYSLLYW